MVEARHFVHLKHLPLHWTSCFVDPRFARRSYGRGLNGQQVAELVRLVEEAVSNAQSGV